MFKLKKDRFIDAVEKADIFCKCMRSGTENGYYVINFEIDPMFWGESVEAARDLCDEWGAECETDYFLDEITLRLKL